jgi:phage/plasmid primase-like uncharacterized protein
MDSAPVQKLTHPYLESKGFPEEVADVWETDGKKLLVLPMRKSGFLIGCQLIDEQGQKKFLQGQTTKGATLSLDAKGMAIFCEGYATGLSIRACHARHKDALCNSHLLQRRKHEGGGERHCRRCSCCRQ